MKQADRKPSAEIRKLHRDATVVLGYVNPWLNYRRGGIVSAREYFTRSPAFSEGTIPQMRKGGVDIAVCSHGVNDAKKFPSNAEVDYMLRCLDALASEVEARPDCVLIRTKGDLDRAIRAGKFGLILHLTGMPINGSLAILRSYWRIGVRVAHPFCSDTQIGGFAYGSKRIALKPWGRDILREMERLSMLVDLTHANDPTFRAAMKGVTKPVMDSHTACRALCNYERNRTDDQLRAIATTGGVIGVHFSSGMIDYPKEKRERHAKLLKWFDRKIARMERSYRDPYEFMQHRWDAYEWPRSLGGAIEDGTKIWRANLDRLVDHVEHMVEVAGIDHVGLGADYDNGDSVISPASKLPLFTEALVRRGFRANEIRKILGGNFLRVFRQTLPD